MKLVLHAIEKKELTEATKIMRKFRAKKLICCFSMVPSLAFGQQESAANQIDRDPCQITLKIENNIPYSISISPKEKISDKPVLQMGHEYRTDV